MNHPDGRPHDLHFLFYGTKLYVKAQTENLSKIILPDKDTLYIKSHNIKPIKGNRIIKINGKDIIKESKRFLGIPYLWGGVTAAGFDCSGFVQTILGRFNVIVPRDTKDQIEIGQMVSRNEIKTGDLLFFKRHVGFAIRKDRIIHSSVGGTVSGLIL